MPTNIEDRLRGLVNSVSALQADVQGSILRPSGKFSDESHKSTIFLLRTKDNFPWRIGENAGH